MKKHNHKLRGNQHASKANRQRATSDPRRSLTRIANINNQQQTQRPPRLGIAAEHAATGYRHNGRYCFGGFYL